MYFDILLKHLDGKANTMNYKNRTRFPKATQANKISQKCTLNSIAGSTNGSAYGGTNNYRSRGMTHLLIFEAFKKLVVFQCEPTHRPGHLQSSQVNELVLWTTYHL
ncbi:hypothetical protein CEXT_325531 [Caerostris extrusa]|uniref:Uncharacterized protein n=1 Tax=Caerostris extrusa TaxID=172846 RepID=A0AAV4V0L1_CAEEX|nr:hypothetical protein CEXT_325531 [Caerostris extrusa]